MLAKNVNDNAFILDDRGAYAFFASKLAPTIGAGLFSGPFGDALGVLGYPVLGRGVRLGAFFESPA